MSTTSFSNQTHFYQGKVRDVYTIDNKWLVMIASNRISAFDVILPKPIPYKGQVLNQIAAYMLDATKDICPNWLLSTPAPNVAIGKKCEPLRVEMVIRGNLAGHAARVYKSGERVLCGVTMPEGMRENDYFPTPIITPSTKAEAGHDEDISKEEVIKQGLMTADQWEKVEQYTRALFEKGKEIAKKQGLILVDTKYEFGTLDGEIILMDEIHTPDSSRYFIADGFEERLKKGEHQKQLSKEFVREWLISNNFMGQEGQIVPELTDEKANEISHRYIELFEKVIGKKFKPEDWSETQTHKAIEETLSQLNA